MMEKWTRPQVVKEVGKVTGLRWCSSHGGFAPAATGEDVATKTGTRWRCATCSKPVVQQAQWREVK